MQKRTTITPYKMTGDEFRCPGRVIRASIVALVVLLLLKSDNSPKRKRKYGRVCDCGHLWHRYSVGPSWSWSHGSWIYNLPCNQCLSPLMLWVRISIRARCIYDIKFVSDLRQVWFSPGPPVSSTYKIDHHGITEILLKAALNTIKQTHK